MGVHRYGKENIMNVLHGTAIYTEDGTYNIIGEFDNGLWFFGCPKYIAIYTDDIRNEREIFDICRNNIKYCEKNLIMLYEPNEEDEDNIEEYLSEDELEDYHPEVIRRFCIQLDNEEPGLTNGYEEFSNYTAGEVTAAMGFSITR